MCTLTISIKPKELIGYYYAKRGTSALILNSMPKGVSIYIDIQYYTKRGFNQIDWHAYHAKSATLSYSNSFIELYNN